MIPNEFFVFDPFSTPYPGTPFWGGGGVGGGGVEAGQNFFAYSGCCVWIWTQVRGNFFHVHGPPNPWRGSRVRTPGTPSRPPLWALASEEFAVFTLDKAV